MYPSDVVLHVVHAAEHPPALLTFGTPPLASDTWVVLRLVASAVFLAGETATARGAPSATAGIGERVSLRLRAAFYPAEKVLGMSVEVLAKVAAASEEGAGGAARVCASPCLRARHSRL
jgi:hypothetical protein